VADHQRQRSDASLTKRGLDVLSLMAEGLTNRRIIGASGSEATKEVDRPTQRWVFSASVTSMPPMMSLIRL
jgi:hypothetical protein